MGDDIVLGKEHEKDLAPKKGVIIFDTGEDEKNKPQDERYDSKTGDEVETQVAKLDFEKKSFFADAAGRKSRKSIYVQKFEEDDLDFIINYPPSLNIDGVKPTFLTHVMQRETICTVGERVSEEDPWILVNKSNLMKALSTTKNDYISKIVEELVENEEKKILVGYISNFDQGNQRGHWFHVAVTAFARKILEEMLEGSRKSLDVGTMTTSVVKTPGVWKSLGSELEIESSSAIDTRPLMELEIKIDVNNLGRPVKFRDSDEVKCYSIGPPRTPCRGVPMKKIDIGVQAVPVVSLATAQTTPGLPVNAWSQYEYDIESAQKAADDCAERELPTDYQFSQIEEMEKALKFNENFNLYKNDYPNLADGLEEEVQTKNIYSSLESYSAVHYCKKKILSNLRWHPQWGDIIACSYSTSVTSEITAKSLLNLEVVDNDVFNQAPILIWSIKDALEPRLVLKCPRETNVLQWCPMVAPLLISGSVGGQIYIWDLTGCLEAVESHEVLTREQDSNRNDIRKLMAWSIKITQKKFVNPSAVSCLQESHFGMVTGLTWLSPFFRINANGHCVEVPEDSTSLQFMTTGEDGHVLIWEIDRIPEEFKAAAEESKRKKIHLKRNQFMESKSPYYVFNHKLKPIFKIVVRPEPGKELLFSISCLLSELPGILSKKKLSSSKELLPLFNKLTSDETSSETISEDASSEQTRSNLKIGDIQEHESISSQETVTDIFEMENFSIEKGMKRDFYELTWAKTNKPKQAFSIGTNFGECVGAHWDGYDFDTGEAIMTANAVIDHFTKGVHDGPIVGISRSHIFPELFVTVGGTVLAVWSTFLQHVPIMWKSRPTNLVSVSWSSYHPTVFRVGRADGTIELWEVLVRSDKPVKQESISGDLITDMSDNIEGDQWNDTEQNKSLIAVADFSNSLRIMKIPKMAGYSDNLCAKMNDFVSNQTEIANNYREWNKKFSEDNAEVFHLKREKEQEEVLRLRELEEKTKKAAELQARLENQEVKKLDGRNRFAKRELEKKEIDDGEKMLQFLFNKKKLNKEELMSKLEPLTIETQSKAEREKRRQDKIKQQDKNFEKTISIVFTEMKDHVAEHQTVFETINKEIKSRRDEFLNGFERAVEDVKKIEKNLQLSVDLQKAYLNRIAKRKNVYQTVEQVKSETNESSETSKPSEASSLIEAEKESRESAADESNILLEDKLNDEISKNEL